MIMKIFDKWDMEKIEVRDIGLKKYINLTPAIVPRSRGRRSKHQFHKSKMNIVERLINKMMVPGHRSKKHVLTSGRTTGKIFVEQKIVKKVFEQIEKMT